MKKFLYILLWVLTVLNLAFCGLLLVAAITMMGDKTAGTAIFGGIIIIFYYFISIGTTALSTGLSFITIKNKKLRVVLYVNLFSVAVIIATTIILFGFAFPQNNA